MKNIQMNRFGKRLTIKKVKCSADEEQFVI